MTVLLNFFKSGKEEDDKIAFPLVQRSSNNWALLRRAWRSIARNVPGADRADVAARLFAGWGHSDAGENDAIL
jgi:hypothetical protein